MPTHGEELLAKGWKSGSVLSRDFYETVRPHLRHGEEAPPARISPDDWLIVVSQTCDVVAFKDDAEPHVEVLLAHVYQGQPRAQFRDLKSTRWLDFRPNRDLYPQTVLTAHATVDRFFVPRRLLVAATPDPERRLSSNATRRLQDWLSLRASRPAWPNELAARLRPAEGALKAALEALTEEIAEVRVAIVPNDRELDAGQPYNLAVYFVVAGEHFENPAVRRVVQESFNAFVGALARCGGIAVEEEFTGVVSGDEFTWAEDRSTDLWNFAYLSQED